MITPRPTTERCSYASWSSIPAARTRGCADSAIALLNIPVQVDTPAHSGAHDMFDLFAKAWERAEQLLKRGASHDNSIKRCDGTDGGIAGEIRNERRLAKHLATAQGGEGLSFPHGSGFALRDEEL